MSETVTGPVLAEMLGVATRHLGNLERSGILVKADRGLWVLRDSVRNYCAHIKERDLGDDFEKNKARKMAADADYSEIQAAKAAGELVMAKSVRRAWEAGIEIAITKLLAVGPKVAARVILEKQPKPAAEIITAGIRAALEEVHKIHIDPVKGIDPAEVEAARAENGVDAVGTSEAGDDTDEDDAEDEE